jgi:hypothetical protein
LVPEQQVLAGDGIALAGALKQFFGVGWCVGHLGGPFLSTNPALDEKVLQDASDVRFRSLLKWQQQ